MNETKAAEQEKLSSLSQFATQPEADQLPVPYQQPHVAISAGFQSRIIGAQPVAVRRSLPDIWRSIGELAARAGDSWLYRYPVKDHRTGRVTDIEGPSIKLANAVALCYGNVEVRTQVYDQGDSWCIYAQLFDIERGVVMERPWIQAKGAARLKSKDPDRLEAIALQIGVSKAIRNVIVNGLQVFCDHAEELARASIVEKLGKNLDHYREKALRTLGELGVGPRRVARILGRAPDKWTAPDLAQVHAQIASVRDGMANSEEMWPPVEGEIEDAIVVGEEQKTETRSDSVSHETAKPGKAKEKAKPARGRQGGRKKAPAPDSGEGASAAPPASSQAEAAKEEAPKPAERAKSAESGRKGKPRPSVLAVRTALYKAKDVAGLQKVWADMVKDFDWSEAELASLEETFNDQKGRKA
jgi:hypothetical protein